MAISEREIQEWATWLRAAGRPRSTIELRTYHVRRVMREIETDPWSLTVEDLMAYLAGKDWAPETRRSYRASLRAFYAWAQATGRRLDSPAALLPPVKLPRRLPRVCGLRRGEVAALRREHVQADLLGHALIFPGKGGHERRVPLPDCLAAELLSRPAGWIFPSSARPGPLTAAHVGKIVSRLLPDGWTCHTLRHRCATVAYRATRDLRAVQELLGHAKPETTALYTQVPDDAVRAAIAATAA